MAQLYYSTPPRGRTHKEFSLRLLAIVSRQPADPDVAISDYRVVVLQGKRLFRSMRCKGLHHFVGHLSDEFLPVVHGDAIVKYGCIRRLYQLAILKARRL